MLDRLTNSCFFCLSQSSSKNVLKKVICTTFQKCKKCNFCNNIKKLIYYLHNSVCSISVFRKNFECTSHSKENIISCKNGSNSRRLRHFELRRLRHFESRKLRHYAMLCILQRNSWKFREIFNGKPGTLQKISSQKRWPKKVLHSHHRKTSLY